MNPVEVINAQNVSASLAKIFEKVDMGRSKPAPKTIL